ncbi:MAG: ATP:cobalamin adenosyltransferase [Parcubacteria group bacterium GW2011_GWF1_40_5]|nr:MAG: ATP:cobalamin adenosyltransferase [Parcubacteria group bacterium GW2011_GWF1_40_5]
MLYTRKGDDGTTKTFGCNQRISKSSAVAEALGALDETNSFLGLARARTEGKSFDIEKEKMNFAEIILEVQQNLFIVQAEVAGSTD